MSDSNVYPFPTAPVVSRSSSAINPRRRVRSRALSLLSVYSARSERTSTITLESQKTEPTIFSSNSLSNHLACGSFVPNAPATAVLRTLIPSLVTHVRGRTSHASSRFEKDREFSSSSSSPVPFITRTLSLSSDSPSPSPIRAYSTLHKVRRGSKSRTQSEVYPYDIHPILASLEQRSKFCVNKGICSTCERVGSGFPQCGKCGNSWCSRECRLNDGKKHSCKNRPT